MLGFQPLSNAPLSSALPPTLIDYSLLSKRRFINLEGVTDTNLIFVNKTGNLLLLTAPTENHVTVTTTTNRVS